MANVKTKNDPKLAKAEGKPKNSSNTALIVIIVLLIVFFVIPGLVLGIGGLLVGGKIKQFTKQAGKGEIKMNIGGESVSFNGAENQSWPSSAPSTVPQLKAGKITSATRLGDTWTITYSGVKPSDFSAYIGALTTSGYTMDEISELGTIKNGGGVKSGYRVNISYTEDEKGAGSILIGIVKEQSN